MNTATEIKQQDVSVVQEIIKEVNGIVIDKEEAVHLMMVAILSRGHVLLEGAPGMGKTSLVKCFVKLLGLSNSRIQFTNDMLPADILGASIYEPNGGFQFHPGPVFHNIVLADEINRATPKTQSACLQAMEEKQIDIDGNHYDLPKPFYVFATQNPEESIGTFPLPESQLDRFFMRIDIGLPSRKGEQALLLNGDRHQAIEGLTPKLGTEKLEHLMLAMNKVVCSDSVIEYILDLVEKSRELSDGLSPRASQELKRAAQASAFIEGRDFVIPEDVQRVAVAVMNHRIGSDHTGVHTNSMALAKDILKSVSVA